MSKPLNSSSSPTYCFPHPTPPREIAVPVCAGLEVEFSPLAAAQVPVQGSPLGLGELAAHLAGRPRRSLAAPVRQPQQHPAASFSSTEMSGLSLPPYSVGFNTQDIVQIKMSWGHNRFF